MQLLSVLLQARRGGGTAARLEQMVEEEEEESYPYALRRCHPAFTSPLVCPDLS